MEVGAVEDMRRQQMSHHLFPEQMVFILQPFPYAFHVVQAFSEIVLRKFHHRILQQGHVTYETVIAAYAHRSDKGFGQAHYYSLETGRSCKVRHKRGLRQNDVIALHDVVPHVAKDETHARILRCYRQKGFLHSRFLPYRSFPIRQR